MDVNMLQQQQVSQQPIQQQQTTPQQIQVVRTNQQSPSGRHSKLPDLFLESNNAFDNKIESPSPSSNNNHHVNNNLLIMANEHKEFSCSMSMGDENNLSSSSPVNSTSSSSNSSVINIINNSNTSNVIVVDNHKNKLTTNITSESDESQPKVSSSSHESGNVESKADCKNANITVASNIANAFVNLSTNSNKAGTSPAPVAAKNLNVIVTQQQLTQQHLMKTVSFTTSRGIFVPNVIATNIAPQFTIHQYGLHGNNSGPAPNVTVNPNGEFVNSNSGTVRPANPNHFRLLLQQSPNINFNIINQNPANPSPILEASLQTITKEATLHATKFIPTKTIYPNQIINTRTIVQNQTSSTVVKTEEPETPTQEVSSNNSNNDQHIRVLTPSEIMKTLPSLSSQDNNPCFSSSNNSGEKQASHENESNRKPSDIPTTVSSGSVASTS
jgi:hypothetical protein